MFDKKAFINKVFSKEFNNKLEEKLIDLHWDILNNDPERYEGWYNSNPYGVEPQLASGSGCWEFSDGAKEEAYEAAKEELLLGIDEEYFDGIPDIKDVNELVNEDDAISLEWVKEILSDIIRKKVY